MKLDLEKLSDGVIVKTKGSGFERKKPDEINTYYIKIGDKLINSAGFLYVDSYDGFVNLDTDWEDYDIEKIWELPIFRIDISYIIKNYILDESSEIATKLIYENKEIRTFTKTELKEKMESILGYPIKIIED